MLMKVFNKGQVVIPSAIRHLLKIEVGDMLDLEVDSQRKILEIRKPETFKADELAGCFSKHGHAVHFPSRQKMHDALSQGLLREKK